MPQQQPRAQGARTAAPAAAAAGHGPRHGACAAQQAGAVLRGHCAQGQGVIPACQRKTLPGELVVY